MSYYFICNRLSFELPAGLAPKPLKLRLSNSCLSQPITHAVCSNVG